MNYRLRHAAARFTWPRVPLVTYDAARRDFARCAISPALTAATISVAADSLDCRLPYRRRFRISAPPHAAPCHRRGSIKRPTRRLNILITASSRCRCLLRCFIDRHRCLSRRKRGRFGRPLMIWRQGDCSRPGRLRRRRFCHLPAGAGGVLGAAALPITGRRRLPRRAHVAIA